MSTIPRIPAYFSATPTRPSNQTKKSQNDGSGKPPGKNPGFGPAAIGGVVAGCVEVGILYPFDVAKLRLSDKRGAWRVPGQGVYQNAMNLKQVIKPEGLGMYPGLRFGLLYKANQRLWNFGMGIPLNNYLKENHRDSFVNVFGAKHADRGMSFVKGLIIGWGEVVLPPVYWLDTLKYREAKMGTLKPAEVVGLLKQPKVMWGGAGWAILRNTPGNPAYWLCADEATRFLLQRRGADPNSNAQLQGWETLVPGAAGAVGRVTASQAQDVIKMRFQVRQEGVKVEGFVQMLRTEGVGVLFKGYGVKLLQNVAKFSGVHALAVAVASKFIKDK